MFHLQALVGRLPRGREFLSEWILSAPEISIQDCHVPELSFSLTHGVVSPG